MEDRRRHRRSSAYAVAGIADEARTQRWVALTTNVSISGLSLRTRAPLNVGEIIRVHVVHARRAIRGRARVVRVSPVAGCLYTSAVAVEFVEATSQPLAASA